MLVFLCKHSVWWGGGWEGTFKACFSTVVWSSKFQFTTEWAVCLDPDFRLRIWNVETLVLYLSCGHFVFPLFLSSKRNWETMKLICSRTSESWKACPSQTTQFLPDCSRNHCNKRDYSTSLWQPTELAKSPWPTQIHDMCGWKSLDRSLWVS